MKTKLFTLASICLCFFKAAHPQYISSTYTDVSAPYLNQGSINNPIVRVTVEMGAVPVPVNSLTFTHTCSTLPAIDIDGANVYYTGNNSTFSTLTQYGNKWNFFPIASFTFSSAQSLLPGYNYFWLTYDISPAAGCGGYAGGNCVGISVNSVNYSPVLVGPPSCPVICGTTGINTNSTFSAINITASPNPATDKIYISFPAIASENITTKIFSITGEVVFAEENKSAAPITKFQIPIFNILNGIYFLSVQTGREVMTRKIVVNH